MRPGSLLISGGLLFVAGIVVLAISLTILKETVLQIASVPMVFLGIGLASFALIYRPVVSRLVPRSNEMETRTQRPNPKELDFEFLLGGLQTEFEPLWTTKPRGELTRLVGMPKVVQKFCPKCELPASFTASFCEHCGFNFRGPTGPVAVRLAADVPSYATQDSLPSKAELVYDWEGRIIGSATGKGDSLRAGGEEALAVRTRDGRTFDYAVTRLLLLPSGPASPSPTGTLILMPEWFIELHSVLAIGKVMENRLRRIAEILSDGSITEEIIVKAYARIESQIRAVEPAKILAMERRLSDSRTRLRRLKDIGEPGTNAEIQILVISALERYEEEISSARASLREAKLRASKLAKGDTARKLVELIPDL